jgi:hypothetical protein
LPAVDSLRERMMVNDDESAPDGDGPNLPRWWPAVLLLGLALVAGIVYLYVLARP